MKDEQKKKWEEFQSNIEQEIWEFLFLETGELDEKEADNYAPLLAKILISKMREKISQ